MLTKLKRNSGPHNLRARLPRALAEAPGGETTIELLEESGDQGQRFALNCTYGGTLRSLMAEGFVTREGKKGGG
jgi:hypothetical protein